MPTETTPTGCARISAPAPARRARVQLATFAGLATLAALSFVLAVPRPAFGADDPAPAKTLAELRTAAKSGAPQALLDLADELAYGEEVTEESQAESATWYRRAAEKGNAEGQHQLALMLWNGEGVEKNQTEAVQWFRRAADQGKANSQYWLATAYEFGDGGLTADVAEAARLYERAANHDFPVAMIALAEAYEQGRGVMKNPVCAYFWYLVAADRGYAAGDEKREALAAKLSEADRAEGQRMIGASEVGDGEILHPACPGELKR